jgi:hypothetical protein
MELTSREQKFSKAFEAIEDLYALGGTELYPIFDRLLYQVGELSRLNTSSVDPGIPRYNGVEKLFRGHAERLVQIYFGSLGPNCHVALSSQLKDTSVSQIDLICELLPHVFNAGSIFNFQKNLSIELKSNAIIFKGKVELSEDLEKLRLDCYRLSRTFLDFRVLFTFESLEADAESLYDIQFKFSIPEETSQIFAVEIGTQRWLSFPRVIGSFEVEPECLKSIGSHKIYTIDESFQLMPINLSNVDEFTQKSGVTALHFPFLFRPISLIISGKGSVVEKSKLFHQTCTGCDEDLTVDIMPSWQHIDLLELMKN